MCGIVGYAGGGEALPFLIKGLKKLEYRGYDSAGVALLDSEAAVRVVKTKGRIATLEEKLRTVGAPSCSTGVGHTRWATHGEPSDANSHPHIGRSGRIAVVHNGIIENYQQIKDSLIAKGYSFVSATDTEVIAHLLDYYDKGDIVDTAIKVQGRLKGSYALGIVCSDLPGRVVALRKDSPLVVGLGKGENYIASDIPAILEYTRDCILLSDGDVAVLSADGVTVYNEEREVVNCAVFHVEWDENAAEKGGYEHFMLKEIMEEPSAVRDTIKPRVKEGRVTLAETGITSEMAASFTKLHVVACGSAWHAGVVGKYVIERLARVPVEADLASEFRYRRPILAKTDLVVVVSQSGETADTIAALREAKRQGVKTLAIVNVVGSTIAREADHVLYTWAGPEIAVATTKGYTSQVGALYLLAVVLAKARGIEVPEIEDALLSIPAKIESMLTEESRSYIQYLASKLVSNKDIFFIGRGLDYAAALEGSLKLKEISYIHSEAYASGEIKHGTISLIEEGTVVVALATQDDLYGKLMSNVQEVKARGATVVALVKAESVEEAARMTKGIADHVIPVPPMDDLLMPILNVVPLQLLAYHISVERGCDVDKPRNLAKSVTVE